MLNAENRIQTAQTNTSVYQLFISGCDGITKHQVKENYMEAKRLLS